MEEFINFVESPETATIRLNTEVINNLGTALLSVEDENIKLEILKLIKKHSAFVLSTSDKIVHRQRLNIKAVG